MLKYLLGIFLIVIFTTCYKTSCGCDPFVPGEFKATVLDTGIADCKKPLLLFDDSIAVSQFLGVNRAQFIANQLPDSLKIQGKKIIVIAQKLGLNEDFSCTGNGSAYPHVKIVWSIGAH